MKTSAGELVALRVDEQGEVGRVVVADVDADAGLLGELLEQRADQLLLAAGVDREPVAVARRARLPAEQGRDQRQDGEHLPHARRRLAMALVACKDGLTMSGSPRSSSSCRPVTRPHPWEPFSPGCPPSWAAIRSHAVVVDDGSTDGTAAPSPRQPAPAWSSLARAHVGLGAAVRRGLHEALARRAGRGRLLRRRRGVRPRGARRRRRSRSSPARPTTWSGSRFAGEPVPHAPGAAARQPAAHVRSSASGPRTRDHRRPERLPGAVTGGGRGRRG